MGRSYTPKYRVEYRDNSMFLPITREAPRCRIPTMHPARMSWPKHLGKPDNAKAEDLRRKMNQSFQPGDVNAHVSNALGVVVHIYRLWVIEQKTGQWVAEANAPAFEVV